MKSFFSIKNLDFFAIGLKRFGLVAVILQISIYWVYSFIEGTFNSSLWPRDVRNEAAIAYSLCIGFSTLFVIGSMMAEYEQKKEGGKL